MSYENVTHLPFDNMRRINTLEHMSLKTRLIAVFQYIRSNKFIVSDTYHHY